MKKRILSALCAMLMLGVLVINAFAVEVPDFDRKGSIGVTMTYNDQAVPGGTLTLYRVADVVEDDGDYYFVYTSEYESCEVPVDDSSAARIAAALAAIVAENSLEGSVQAISDEGKVTFSDLEIGLYLLIQEEAAPGYNLITPFLVSIPGGSGDGYVYDVDASPKMELVPEPTEPPTEPPVETEPPTEPPVETEPPTEPPVETEPPTEPPTETEPPDLPDTGLTQWPVPVLALSGLVLVVFGMVLRTSEKKKSHES